MAKIVWLNAGIRGLALKLVKSGKEPTAPDLDHR